ncbi:glycoside hydrolase family 32 protein [Halalkalirubrum salinum]|uniref:glycoside hydrolase family 32 protein n=1 Tax=Halalkalirubrum salinum TaxID=2563889 RepID=UPI0010FB1E08|nr:glycoside hydrolase family 32 protein [Halalkalirubrum salinum]
MDALSVRIGCLSVGDRTTEQTAAVEWCQSRGARVDTIDVTPESDSVIDADLATYDVLWWHRDEPVELDRKAIAAAAPAIRGVLESGGRLFLSLHALSAVEPLDIDPIAPDAAGTERIDHPSGFAAKAIHSDHPVFEGFVDRFYTLPAGENRPFARYEAVAPARGQLLGSAVHAGELLPAHKEILSWRVGEGHVYGVGARVEFADNAAGEFSVDRDRFVSNILATLGGDRRPTFTDRPTDAAGFDRLRARFADDHHRPTYHLSPPAGWLNDPNGIIHHDGTYHVFYQYNPMGPFHGTIHWGHATSEDLRTWCDEPVALSPDPDGPDRDGCWSGCAVVDAGGTPTILYTGGRGSDQLPCLATAGDDRLHSWRKDPANPIIPAAPDDPAVLATDDWDAEFRDHNVWAVGDTWYHLIGAGLSEGGGAALLYRGDTLRDWEYVGPLLSGDHDVADTVWECPELLDLGEVSLLHVSNYRDVRYFLGVADLSTPGFAVETEGLLDHGALYAPQSTTTPDGRVLMWGWIKETRSVDGQWRAGWSGALSIPRELSIGSAGDLVQQPARELRALRSEPTFDGSADLTAGEHRPIAATNNALELRAEIEPLGDVSFELGLFESPARSERTVVRCRRDGIVVDRSNSTHDPDPDTSSVRMPIDADGSDGVSLRVFVDGSILTVFANDRHCLTTRVYPSRSDATGVSVAAFDGDLSVRSLTAWPLEASSGDRAFRNRQDRQ